MKKLPKDHEIIRDVIADHIENGLTLPSFNVVREKGSIRVEAKLYDTNAPYSLSKTRILLINLKDEIILMPTHQPSDAIYISYTDPEFLNKIDDGILASFVRVYRTSTDPAKLLMTSIELTSLSVESIVKYFGLDVEPEFLRQWLSLTYGLRKCEKCGYWSRGNMCCTLTISQR